MSDEILIGDKPLHTLRVVDLREELRKRGIRSSGTKSQLQQLLLTAINSSNTMVEVPDNTSNIQENITENTEKHGSPNDSNDSFSNNSNYENITNTEKVASISINEEKETIKLTIRSSPRKSEPVRQKDSETEESQSEDSDSEGSKKNVEDNVNPIQFPSTQNEQDLNRNEQLVKISNDNSKNLKISEEIPEDLKSKENLDDDDFSARVSKKFEQQIEEHIEKIEMQRKQITGKERITEEKTKSENSETQIENDKIETNINSETAKANDLKSKATLRGRLTTQKSQDEKETPKLVQKKRRWGSSQTNASSVLKEGISSDKLKQLINDSVIESDQPAIKVSKTSEEETIDNNKIDEPKTIETTSLIKQEVKKVDVSFKNNNIVEMNKVSSQKENGIEENDKNRSVSPAKNPESTVLFITGLVRPYTLMQLKKLLNNTGKIDEDKFWIDKIKSKCYVTYSSIEEAVETRKALHNLKWPQSSPKNLCIEFATLEDIDRCLHPENYEDLPMKNVERKILENKDINKGKYDIILKEPKVENFNKSVNKPETTAAAAAAARGSIREWDRDKVVVKLGRHEEKNDENLRSTKKHRFSPAQLREKLSKTTSEEQRSVKSEKINKKEESSNQRNPKSESPVNSLEDLFRKTKTIPYIYWLPLTEEQSLEREKQKAQLEKEREARIAQRYKIASRRSPSPVSRNMNRTRSPINRRRSPPTTVRRKPYSPSHRRNTSRYSRSRSPDRRRFSPRRR